MKKIVVPVDFSEFSEQAVKAAIAIANKTKGKIDFLHLQPVDEDWLAILIQSQNGEASAKLKTDDFIKNQQSQLNVIKSKLQQYVDLAKQNGSEAKYTLAYNQPNSAIAKIVKKIEGDLIVMGTHGASGISGFLGSNTQRVVRTAHCPVISIKKDQTNFNFKKAVFASDFQFKNSLGVLNDMLPLLNAMEISVELLYVNTPVNFTEQREIDERMRNFTSHFPNQNFKVTVYNQFSIDEGIENFAIDNNIDLVCMATNGFSGIKGMMHESLCELVVNYSKVPVLSQVI